MLALEIKKLTKIYSTGSIAVNNISLSVEVGDFFALLGANGAGKSTTIGLISTLLKKTSGNINIYGYDLYKCPDIAKSYLGIVPQEFNLNIFETCEQILLNQAGYYGISRKIARPKVKSLLEQLDLLEKKNEIVRHLSGGMKRRLMMARSLIHRPKVLILDEPTAGVDVETRYSMWKFLSKINKQGTTIILTTHYLEEAEQLCKNIAIIHNGKILKNTSMRELLSTLRNQTFIFNTVKPFKYLEFLENFSVKIIDNYSFEIKIDNNISLNDIFSIFIKNSFVIYSMRNKKNRLEELFLDLINNAN